MTCQASKLYCLALLSGAVSAGDLQILQAGPLEFRADAEVQNTEALHKHVQTLFYSRVTGQVDTAQWLPMWRDMHQDLLRLALVAEEQMPALRFAVGIAFYHWHWFHYDDDRPRLNDEGIALGAKLLEAALSYSASGKYPCTDVATQPLVFLQSSCDYKWTHLVMMETELGRERARRLDLLGAEAMLRRAREHFEAMMRLPFFAWRGWRQPLDMNFNSEYYPSPGPVWDKHLIPFAAWLEENYHVFQKDLARIRSNPGLFDMLSNLERNAEGNDHWRLDDWTLIELADTREEEPFKQSCQFANATCSLLVGRPEVGGCDHAWAGFARMRAGGLIKAHMGMGPRLVAHVGLEIPEEQPILLFVGNQTLRWRNGKSHVIDDTYVHSVRHDGFGGPERYILHVLICHPCEKNQRHLYEDAEGRMPDGISCDHVK
eukprot:TRINITY_DN49000_c0_g1_i1.p1 TRINITY_DN49000_c0_g1~~TRINITY_DN49000_c0_g1_i1.p1  ORF type:complete len:431 (-),score=73.84 TRINITY_DN49000_c0_g1_i1:8-1300(-)